MKVTTKMVEVYGEPDADVTGGYVEDRVTDEDPLDVMTGDLVGSGRRQEVYDQL